MKLTDYKKTECHCELCHSMCQSSPCFGTPDDVFTQISHGHKDKLAVTMYVDMQTLKCHAVVAPIQKENKECIFLENKRCSIHKIKGIEGKILHHKHDPAFIKRIRLEVCKTWEQPLGIFIINELSKK